MSDSYEVALAKINLAAAADRLDYLEGVERALSELSAEGATSTKEHIDAAHEVSQQEYEFARCELALKKAKGETA